MHPYTSNEPASPSTRDISARWCVRRVDSGRIEAVQPVGQSSRVVALSADSRDQIDASNGAADGTYAIHVLPRQSVVLHADIFVDPPLGFFYPTASDFEHATPIPIQRPGPIVVNIAAPTG